MEALFRDLPSRFSDFGLKFLTNELPNEVVTQVVKRQLRFSDLFLFNVTAEYTDRIDSVLKSTRNLKLYKCQFRQIFPKDMVNETPNEIESLQMEEVDLRVKNTLFSCDKLKALSLSHTILRPN